MTTGTIMEERIEVQLDERLSQGILLWVMIHGGVTIPGWVTDGIHGMPRCEVTASIIISAGRTIIPHGMETAGS